MKKLKEELKYGKKGITLISLVVTIIVLLILAGVTIATLTGENGILTRTQQAKNETEQAEDIEKIGLAITEAQIGDTGYQELTTGSLGSALIKDGTKAIVFDSEDGTKHILFLDKKKEYKLDSNGNIENLNINFDAKYVAPSSQNEEINNGVIGIGTDGKTVDMDLWLFTYDKTTNGYLLNSEETKNNSDYGGNNSETSLTSGYIGNITGDGKIEGSIPVYISEDNGKTFYPVTSLYRTFQANCLNNENLVNLKVAPTIPVTVSNMLKTFVSASNLENMPIIPEGVTNMESTFYNCSNLNKVTSIPQNVLTLNCTFSNCSKLESGPEIKSIVLTNMYGTFEKCTSLTTAPVIPNGVINMYGTFRNCTSLTIAPVIPNGVINMYGTFEKCTSLTTAPVIPNGVINMCGTFRNCTSLTIAPVIPNSVTLLVATFRGCSNLQGSIEINANVLGKQLGEEFYNTIDYINCLYEATTNPGLTLNVTGSCPVLQQIVENADNPNITL